MRLLLYAQGRPVMAIQPFYKGIPKGNPLWQFGRFKSIKKS